MTNDEAQKLFTGRPRKQPQALRLGDTVRILSGPFASFTGKIEGINRALSLLKVRVKIFGKETHVKLRFGDIEKVSSS